MKSDNGHRLSQKEIDDINARLNKLSKRSRSASEDAAGGGKPGIFASFVSLAIAGFILYSCVGNEPPTKSAAEIASEEARKAADREAGFHCLSAWDGSHSEFKRRIKSSMRDPDSFEHIETRLTPVSAEGTHFLAMQYRAKNGFGGMNIGQASATLKNSDCSFTVLSIE